ncbi:MAG TPA: AMP-binding protein [Acidimicrobiales bacterium]|nr:AMP-binding protein [Acidimicrobiales bacterium]
MDDYAGRIRSPHTTMASGRSVGWLLDLRAEQRGDHPFVVWEPFVGAARTWTYREFSHRTRELAAGLQHRGVRAGDRVILHMDNSPEFLLTWFACTRAGVVPVCTNTRSVRDELSYYTEHSGAVAALTQPQYAALVGEAAPHVKWLAVTETDGTEAGAGAPAPSSGDRFESLFRDAGDFAAPELTAFAPASIQYTSGTTARPKAVVWTHANCLWGGKVSASHETLTPRDVHLVHLPMFHTNAQSYSVLASLWAGATMVVQPRFSASRFWDVSLRHRCTWTSVVHFCVRALESLDVPDRHHYRLWGNGVGSPPQDEKFRVPTIGWWGMTETVTHGIVDDVYNPARSMGCGRPAPEYEVAVLRADGTPVEPGESGALFVRGVPGVSLFAGYLHDEAATRDTVDDQGWLTTGDLVTVHPDGAISFADRAKDMLKVGGENVAASEIEVSAFAVPGVVEVAVVGRRDEMLGEVPVAFVVASDDRPTLADEVLAACRERLADFKVPREVRVVPDLPRSTLNKIAKAELRKGLAAEAGGA